jgi:VWFA-related protein
VSTRCVALSLVLLLATFATAQESVSSYQVGEARWQEAIRSANAEKPIVVLFLPEHCEKTKNAAACSALTAFVNHPATQRRLARFVFLTQTVQTPWLPGVAVYDPAGALTTRWLGMPGTTDFGRMLSLIDSAAKDLAEIARASKANDVSARNRASALAAFALGDEAGGRTGLEALRNSAVPEDRELGAIWLMRITPPQSSADSRRENFMALGRSGSTDRVKFEAWMAAGDLDLAKDRIDDASEAFRRALEVAPAKDRKVALAALQRVTANTSPLLGLGSPGSLVFGRRTIQPLAIGPNAAKVELRLDGRLVATARRAPFTSSVNFGRIPKRQTLSMTIVDKAGKKTQRSVVVNERSNAFSVRIDEPAGATFSGNVDVSVSMQIPRGSAIESVVVEWNGVAVAYFTAPPYRTRLSVRKHEEGILRAAVRLDDGAEAEDVRLANASGMTFGSVVNLVEVPAYFEESSVTADKVLLREGGKPLAVERLIAAAEAPLRVALVLDASSSMADNILDLQEAALQFVESNLAERDETMVVEFGSALQIQPPTSDRARTERAILRMLPLGSTSLHDAMITALMRLQVSGWRRALVVFSDGMDTSSIFRAGDVAEVARRIGVPIYVLSFAPTFPSAPSVPSLPGQGHGVLHEPTPEELAFAGRQELARISANSGGKAFKLRSLDQLSSIWNEIGADLRKQSLVIYRTDSTGPEWRTLQLSIKGGRRIRAPSGVYVVADEK